MNNVKIFSENGLQTEVNGLFYIFDSKYYFMYTQGELDENEYVKLYVAQVCKEVKNTATGPVDTGYMLGMEISNSDDWVKVQQSITKIVEDKKNNTQSSEIQYLPINMLVNLKVIGKNKFKLMKHIVEDDFKVTLKSSDTQNLNSNISANNQELQMPVNNEVLQQNTDLTVNKPVENVVPVEINSGIQVSNEENNTEVIIDYRTRFFEEQEKNRVLQDEINALNQKLQNIKQIIE